VAVKVQFPQLRERCEGDVATIAFLVDQMARIFPDFDFQWLVGEFRLNLPKELDFVHEAKNAERTAQLFLDFPNVTIPRIHWDTTTSRILTMDYVHGVKLDDREGIARLGLSTQKVAELLTTVFSKQIFQDGFVPCDPHPGNVLLRRFKPQDPSSDDPELVLLDHGLYRELDEEFRINYCKLWVGIIHADEAKIEEYSRILCGPDASYQLFACMLTARAWESVKELDQPITQAEKNHLMSNAASRFKEINDILATVPSQLLLLLKTNDLLRALNRDLGHPVNTYSITAKYCVRALLDHSLKLDPSWRHKIWVQCEALAWAVQIKATEVLLRLFTFFSRLLGR
jgi:aarF domain-containing kinase